jgi:hypothetical protein
LGTGDYFKELLFLQDSLDIYTASSAAEMRAFSFFALFSGYEVITRIKVTLI